MCISVTWDDKVTDTQYLNMADGRNMYYYILTELIK
jgi:hypothetical protein